MMSSDEEEDEVPEDSRIATLYSAADKKSPEEWAALLGELGTKDALVYGSICMDPASVRSHFIVASLIDADDGTLAECLEAKRAHIKAAVLAGGEGAGAFLLAALEGFVCNDVEGGPDREAAIGSFRKALKALWEWEIVSEEDIRAWQPDERAGRVMRVQPADARRLHEQGRLFVEWVDRGEDGGED